MKPQKPRWKDGAAGPKNARSVGVVGGVRRPSKQDGDTSGGKQGEGGIDAMPMLLSKPCVMKNDDSTRVHLIHVMYGTLHDPPQLEQRLLCTTMTTGDEEELLLLADVVKVGREDCEGAKHTLGEGRWFCEEGRAEGAGGDSREVKFHWPWA